MFIKIILLYIETHNNIFNISKLNIHKSEFIGYIYCPKPCPLNFYLWKWYWNNVCIVFIFVFKKSLFLILLQSEVKKKSNIFFVNYETLCKKNLSRIFHITTETVYALVYWLKLIWIRPKHLCLGNIPVSPSLIDTWCE